ncbi:MAG: hypothetical protein O3A00_10210 [Planctomycetota bacterium]|nr:hypothetical protein [Planctomycetota bacterium]
MAVEEKTNEALDLLTLRLPPSPPVCRIEWQEYQDSTGEPSLRLQVVLAENTDVSKVSGEQVGELKAAIRESLVAHGVSKFPYIFITTPEELAEPNDEE